MKMRFFLLAAIALSLAGCKTSPEPPENLVLSLDSTNATPQIKIPVAVRVEPKPAEEMRLPVTVKVEPVADAPVKVSVALTNDSAASLAVPVTLRADTNGIPIQLKADSKETQFRDTWQWDILKLIIAASLAVLTASLAAAFTFCVWRYQKQIEHTVTYTEKYYSADMTRTRIMAYNFLVLHMERDPDSNVVTNREGMPHLKISDVSKEEIQPEKKPCPECQEQKNVGSLQDVLSMLEYYERMAIMGENGTLVDSFFSVWRHSMINQKLARELIGWEFRFWFSYIQRLGFNENAQCSQLNNLTEVDWSKAKTWETVYLNIEKSKKWLAPHFESPPEASNSSSAAPTPPAPPPAKK